MGDPPPQDALELRTSEAVDALSLPVVGARCEGGGHLLRARARARAGAGARAPGLALLDIRVRARVRDRVGGRVRVWLRARVS